MQQDKNLKITSFGKKKKSDKKYYKGYLVYKNSKGRYINKKGSLIFK